MLVLKIPAVAEFWDEINEEFIYSEEVTLAFGTLISCSVKMGIEMAQVLFLKMTKQMKRLLITSGV